VFKGHAINIASAPCPLISRGGAHPFRPKSLPPTTIQTALARKESRTLKDGTENAHRRDG